jgi:hypothetical protein
MYICIYIGFDSAIIGEASECGNMIYIYTFIYIYVYVYEYNYM